MGYNERLRNSKHNRIYKILNHEKTLKYVCII